MRAFRFRLQRIMEFRHTRLAEEERKLKLLQMELNAVAGQIEDVRRARHQSARALTSREALRGEDLRALAGFQARLRRNETMLQQRHAVCVRKLRQQEEAFQVSRRDYRLLEELRKRRFAEWLQASNRELDQLASELYLARWDCKPRG
jgi:uncharacterized protein with NAD-binding domain and iron-sulfur cluster